MTQYYEYFMNVWEPLVDDYLAMGWTFASDDPIISDDRGGHLTFLMVWQCNCKPRYVHHRYKHLTPPEKAHAARSRS